MTDTSIASRNKSGTSFDQNTLEYDLWYEKHSAIYKSELNAVKQAVPPGKKGIEIGVGTGRFSTPFNITIGVEPSANMAKLAEERGITVINAVAENLPFHKESFDFVLMVTTVCFLSDIPKAFSEACRILRKDGAIIIGLIDRNSDLGNKYEQKKASNKFYKDAHFHTTEEVTDLLKKVGFNQFSYWQTLTHSEITQEEKPIPGFDKGSFVVIKTIK